MVMNKDQCDHLPDFTSTHPANGAEDSGIVDIWCAKCGQCGSVRIDPDDIQWEDMTEGN
jgi:hypothetical protein